MFACFFGGVRVDIVDEETCSLSPETARKLTDPMGLGETTNSPLEPIFTSPGGVKLEDERDIRTKARRRDGNGQVDC